VVEHEDGYLLARPPESIRMVEVLRIFTPSQYQRSESEPDQLDQVLAKLEKQQQQTLTDTTFADLL
jgi:DNA-binding IscR family transcriptional regulator